MGRPFPRSTSRLDSSHASPNRSRRSACSARCLRSKATVDGGSATDRRRPSIPPMSRRSAGAPGVVARRAARRPGIDLPPDVRDLASARGSSPSGSRTAPSYRRGTRAGRGPGSCASSAGARGPPKSRYGPALIVRTLQVDGGVKRRLGGTRFPAGPAQPEAEHGLAPDRAREHRRLHIAWRLLLARVRRSGTRPWRRPPQSPRPPGEVLKEW